MVKKFNAKFRVGQGGLIVVTSDVTLEEGADQLVLVDASAGPITVTLQRADGSGGKRFCIKKIDGTVNVVTIEPIAGQTIDGGPNQTIAGQNDFIDIISDNENWLDIGEAKVAAPLPHDFLSPTHLDTVPATPPATGSLAKGDGANLWAEFILGAANAALVVNPGATDLIYALIKNANVDPTAAIAQSKLAPITLGDLPNLPVLGVAPASPRQTNIVNAEVDVGAAIAQSKLAPITLGDLPNLPVLGTPPASPRQINIVNAEIAAAAAIALTKLAAVTANRALESNGSGIIIASTVTTTELGLLSGRTATLLTTSQIAQIVANHTFNNLTFRIRNPGNSASYVFNASAIVADRNAKLPLLTADDEVTFNEMIQILKNKNFNTADNTLDSTGANVGELLKRNATKFVRFPKGTALQQIRVNAAGTDLEYVNQTPSLLLHATDQNPTVAVGTDFIAFSGSDPGSSTEINAENSFPVAVKIQNITIKVSTMSNANSTFNIRKNGAAGNATVTIPASTTGTFRDIVNTDDFGLGDVGNYQVTANGVGTLTTDSVACEVVTQ